MSPSRPICTTQALCLTSAPLSQYLPLVRVGGVSHDSSFLFCLDLVVRKGAKLVLRPNPHYWYYRFRMLQRPGTSVLPNCSHLWVFSAERHRMTHSRWMSRRVRSAGSHTISSIGAGLSSMSE